MVIDLKNFSLILLFPMLLFSCSTNSKSNNCPYGSYGFESDLIMHTEEETLEASDLYYIVLFKEYEKETIWIDEHLGRPSFYTKYYLDIVARLKGNEDIDYLYLFVDHTGCAFATFEEKVNLNQQYYIYLKYNLSLNGYSTTYKLDFVIRPVLSNA